MNAKLISNNKRRRREAIGPLVPYLSAFTNALYQKGYKSITINHCKCYLLDFSQWLHKRNLRTENINEKLIDEFYSVPHKNHYHRKCLINLLCFLREEKILLSPSEPTRNFILTPLVNDFKEYLIKERGILSPESYNRYLKVAYDFISECIGNEKTQPLPLDAKKVTDFLLSYLHGQ